jgi:subtilisin family serine protease
MRNVRAFDTDGHGTHVCGIIAGQGVGIAPDVDLLVAAVIESETLKTNLERIALGLDWMLSQITQPDNVDKPSIINMSLGFKQNWLEGDDLKTALSGMRKIIRTLVDDFDVLPVIAVGNDGRGVIRVPASFDEVLAVGALTYNNEPWDRSGGGNSPLTQSIKPDIAGYGVDVLSSIERDVDNKSWYARMTGTSMATPYVSGIAALLASSDNRLQGQRLRERLIENAHSMDFPQDRVGVGLARYS